MKASILLSSFLRLCFCPFLLLFCIKGQGDIVILGGYGSRGFGSEAPTYPIANSFSIGDQTTTPLLSPHLEGLIMQTAVDPLRGLVIFVGIDEDHKPMILQGSVVSSAIKKIKVPPLPDESAFTCAAIDSEGNAIIGGNTPSEPLIFKLPYGASEAIPISTPHTRGALYQVAISLDNTAILVGGSEPGGSPLIFSLPSQGTEAMSVSLPDPSLIGSLTAIAIGTDGTAIMGGQNESGNGEALIYRLLPHTLSAQAIAIPSPNDGGKIHGVAINQDQTALLVGEKGIFSSSPLIYKIPPNSHRAHLIENPNDHEGTLIGIAIGSDGTAIAGGADDTTLLPLIYKFTAQDSQARSIEPPNSNAGTLISVAIGSEDVAILAGSYTDGHQLLIFTLPLNENKASALVAPTSFDDEILMSLAIYSVDGPYDIRAFRPHYYLQVSETLDTLKRLGWE